MITAHNFTRPARREVAGQARPHTESHCVGMSYAGTRVDAHALKSNVSERRSLTTQKATVTALHGFKRRPSRTTAKHAGGTPTRKTKQQRDNNRSPQGQGR